MKRLLLICLLPALCFAQSPGIGLDSLPGAPGQPPIPSYTGNEFLFGYYPGSGGSGPTVCARGYCPGSFTLNSLKTYFNAGGGGSGTVTSVGITGSGILSFTNSPITTTGNMGALWTLTSGGVPCATGANTLTSSSVLSAGQPVVGGGIGGCVSTSNVFPPTSNILGYLGFPVSGGAIKTASYTLVLNDQAFQVQFNCTGSPCVLTIPANSSVAFPIGTYVEIDNICTTSETLTISITSDTLFFAPGGATGSRTMSICGEALIKKETATTWKIMGQGVT
jgi:hypothetical protein